MITVHLEEACVAFEKLPLIENVDFLRNILYSGIWIRFNIATGKRSGSATAMPDAPADATGTDDKEEGGQS